MAESPVDPQRNATCRRCGGKYKPTGLKHHTGSLLCDAVREQRRMARRGLLYIPMPRRAWATLRVAGARIERAYGQYVSGAMAGGSYTRSCNFVEPWAAAVASVMTWVEPSITRASDPRVQRAARVVRWVSPGDEEHILFTIPWLLAAVLTHINHGRDENVRGVIRVPVHTPSGLWMPGPPRLVRRSTFADMRDVVHAFDDDTQVPAERWFMPSSGLEMVKRYAIAQSIRRGEHLTNFVDELLRKEIEGQRSTTIRVGTALGVPRSWLNSNAGRAQLLRERLLHVARQG